MPELNKCRKRTDYFIQYEIAEPGVEVYNKLEKAKYCTDEEHNIILTGTVGEQWVTTKEKLNKTYKIHPDKNNVRFGIAKPTGSDNNFYEFSDKEQYIETSWGTKLQAKVGDAIVYSMNRNKPDLDDRWVVDREVFENTYSYK